MKRTSPSRLASVLAMILLLVPFTAHAGLLTDMTSLLSQYITPQDESIAMLKNVFGDFTLDPFNQTGGGGGTGNLLGSMFKQYNIFVFTIAMFWFAYNAAASLAQTMHEGVVLGQRMSTIWLPIRVAFGALSLMPIFGGWAFCQALMMFSTTLGIAGANSIANVAVSSAAQFQTIVNPMGSVKAASSLKDVELNLLRMVACQEAAGALNTEGAANNVTLSGSNAGSFMHAFWPTNDRLQMAFPSNAGATACGAINLQFSTRTNDTIGSSFGFRIGGVDYAAIRKLSLQAHQATLAALAEDARAIVKGSAALSPVGGVEAAVDKVKAGYFGSYSRVFQTKLDALSRDTNAASGKAAIDQALLDKMQNGGWATLGIWYGVFAEVNEGMNEMLDPVVTFDDPKIQSTTQEDLNAAIVGLIAKSKADDKLQPSNSLTTATGNTSLGQYILGGAIAGLGGSSSTGASGTINPILVFKNMGDNSISLAESAFAAYEVAKVANAAKTVTPLGAAASVAGSIAEKTLETAAEGAKPQSGPGSVLSGLASSAAQQGGAMLFTALVALFGAALLMSFYLPMIPFIQWFAGLIHWFISVVESFLGASLWALAHFDSDGEGMGQRASYGYQYMLSNFARPLIMTIGFFVASATVTVLGTFLFKYFGSAIASAAGNTVTGLLSIVAYLCILAIMGIALINNSFSIFLKLADTIIAFVGSSAHSAFQADTESRISGLFINASTKMSQGVRTGGLGKPSAPAPAAAGRGLGLARGQVD